MVPGGCPPRPADDPPLPNPPTIEFEWERGRVVDDAILGRAETPFRELLLGVPEARLLRASFRLHRQENMNSTHRFLITSVFNERGRTTPCNF